MSRSEAVFGTDWPDRTSEIARWRNSAGYLRGMGRAFHQGPISTANLETIHGAGHKQAGQRLADRAVKGSTVRDCSHFAARVPGLDSKCRAAVPVE
jgi:hypothetical protein